MTSDPVLDPLRRYLRIPQPVAIVVAHADDETFGMGGTIGLLDRVSLVHVTDRAPEDPRAWHRIGLGTREEYAALRRRELDAAIAAAGWTFTARSEIGITDQQVVHHLEHTIDLLEMELNGKAAVFTHAYEGGHPDHDAVALAVALACKRIGDDAPTIYEFAGYHLAGPRRVAGYFYPSDAFVLQLEIAGEPLKRKRRALEQFESQGSVRSWFDPRQERYRRAPAYRFTDPPPPGVCFYDRKALPITSTRWREITAAPARELLEEVGQ